MTVEDAQIEQELRDAWHADDCLGYPMCDGCGYIAADMCWYPGPCPEGDRPHQVVRSELNQPFAIAGDGGPSNG